MPTPALLRTIEGVGRVQSLRKLDDSSMYVGVAIGTDNGPLTGVADLRSDTMAALFPDARVAPVAVAYRDVDVFFRFEVRRSPIADPKRLDCDLSPSETRRWLVALRPAEEGDTRGPVVVDLVDPAPVANAKAFTANLRAALAGLCLLPPVEAA